MSEASRTAGDMPLPGGEFSLFLTRISIQGLLACGVIENPVTGEKQTNEGMARALLADLEMLQDKTRGNLEEDEAAHLGKILEDYRAVFEKTFSGEA